VSTTHLLQLVGLDLHLSSAKFLSMHKFSVDWPDENPDDGDDREKLDEDDGREKLDELKVLK
jgi:hypothetical protein